MPNFLGVNYDRLLCVLAFFWRTVLFRTTVIAITGSVGKTSCKDLLAEILSRQGPTVATTRSNNGRSGIPRAILRARPWHRFLVIEVGIDQPGHMIRHAFIIRPDIAVILSVASPHLDTMGSLEVIADEKAKLAGFQRPGDAVLLNDDDPRVSAMAEGMRGKVFRFGSRPECDVWADDVSGAWPSRFGFRVVAGGESCRAETQYVGKQWYSTVLAAAATAHVCGVPLETACKAAAEVKPYTARMEPVALSNGAVMLRDETHGNLTSTESALEVMREASATRRVLVLSDINGVEMDYEERQRLLARLAAQSGDVALFVSEKSEFAAARAVEEGMPPENVHHAATVREGAQLLRRETRKGDLVLLQGRWRDHLTRIYFSQIGEVSCWLDSCELNRPCDRCPQLGFRPFPASASASDATGGDGLVSIP